MHPVKPPQTHAYLPSYLLGNRGVTLVKGKIGLRVKPPERWKVTGRIVTVTQTHPVSD
jgi:hypothetical protein